MTHNLPLSEVFDRLEAAASARILVMDGAMGTMIQRYSLAEAEYRGERFAGYNMDVKGNNDLLCLTQPHIIADVHDAFLEAGADIIETNSFNGTSISLADYGMESLAAEINESAAQIARKCADAYTVKNPSRPRFVAGSVGPTNKTLSVSPDVNNPGFREVTFDQMVTAYKEQISGLIKGGVDIILIETIFDTLNAKAAIFAAEDVFEDQGYRLPMMISCTVTDMSGRNLSGQTVEAFWCSVKHAKPFSVGLNCAFGADLLRAPAVELAGVAETKLAFYPNAGLPNEMGEYDETPDVTAGHLAEWAKEGLVNIVGGCCGTTPDHIAAIAAAVEGVAPRRQRKNRSLMRLSGLEAVAIEGLVPQSVRTVSLGGSLSHE